MSIILSILAIIAIIVISSVVSIFILSRYMPFILERFFRDSNESEEEDKPLLISLADRMGTLEESSPEDLQKRMDKIFEDFISGKPLLLNYKQYETHKEMDFGPPIQCGID